MKKFKNFKHEFFKWKYLDIFLLSLFFISAFILRSYLIGSNLFFGPEQGRDMLSVKDIVVNHKLTLIGPTTAIEGVFHGPLYFYIAAIPFFISKGNPIFISLFFIFLNSLSVFFVYLLGKELFSKRLGLIASLIFTFSFGSIVMARWLSHPPLVIPLSLLFFLFLAKFIKGENKYLIPTAIMYGLVSQTEFSNFIIFAFIILFTVIFFFKRFREQKIYVLFISVFLVIFSPIFNFILFDLRHDFLITKSILKSQTHRPEFISYIFLTLSGSIIQFFKVFADLISPMDVLGAFFIFCLSFFALMKLREKYKNETKILLIWIFAPFVAFIVLRYNPLYHYFASSELAIIFLFVVFCDYLFSLRKEVFYLTIGLFILMNLIFVIKLFPDNKNIFFQSTQPDLKFSDEVSVIKTAYKEANGKPFYFQAFTIPYWMQDGWQYLFWYYGTKDYGYIPAHTNKGLLFVIIQDDPSQPLYQHNWHKNTVLSWGTPLKRWRFGALTLEKLIVK